ncbi:TolC family protein [Sphingomonas cannabina]|uniref:TolC family protein n=1 Tax=Sphingomonas cannabina TaxID=2899123 RepID=UPI001F2856E7|nr:TolC family protein [Sphingomonas cannabina]UIJ43515.1 TolC family protein [Sphingomonas cannabina]
MKIHCAAVMVAVSGAAVAQAPTVPQADRTSATPVYTLEDALRAAGASSPAADAASAGVAAARAGRTAAGLHPNPQVQVQVENVLGSGQYSGFDSAETTVGVAIPVELGGKRGARIAVADAQLSRAELQAAIAQADIRLQVTSLYVETIAAEERVMLGRDQLRIAGEALRAARVRVQSGRASPIEEQRADVARIQAEADLERNLRLARAARENLARRVGSIPAGPLDLGLLDRIPPATQGPVVPPNAAGTLAQAAADADLAFADAGVRLARANRVPDLTVGPGLRRLEQTSDMAAIFSISIPMPLFNRGTAAVDQARAERARAEAQRRVTQLDVEQTITDASAAVDNAATSARAAGPALAAAEEAARIARIGYREGKFGQLDLLDAERTLAQTRSAAIDAFTAYHIAKARLERLTARAPRGDNR